MRQTGEEQNNMVVAVRVRPLSPKEEAAGCQACCKVINQKVQLASHQPFQHGSCGTPD